MYHEKSATRSIEITVRSDSIRDNMILIVKNVPSSALSSKASNHKQGGYSRNIVPAWRFYLIFQFL